MSDQIRESQPPCEKGLLKRFLGGRDAGGLLEKARSKLVTAQRRRWDLFADIFLAGLVSVTPRQGHA